MQKLLWENISKLSNPVTVSHIALKKREKVIAHGHDFPELVLVKEGSGSYTDNENKKFPLEKGALLVSGINDCHSIQAAGYGLSIINIAISPAFYNSLNERCQIDKHWGKNKKLYYLNEEMLRKFNKELEYLCDNMDSLISAKKFILNVLCDILIPAKKTKCGFEGLPEWLTSALTKMENPVHFRHGPAELARLSRHTPEHVARFIKAKTGITPNEIINEIRLQYASKELLLSGKSINDISLECGFRSLSHFYRIFRNRFKETPKLYRLINQAVFPR